VSLKNSSRKIRIIRIFLSVKCSHGQIGGAMNWRQCKVNETADEVRVEVRFLHPGLTLAMLSALTIFWAVLFQAEGPRWPLIAIMLLTSCLAVFMGLATSCLFLSRAQLTTWSRPLSLDRVTRNPFDIQSLSCSFTRTRTGRGTIERYAVEAQFQGCGFKRRTMVWGFKTEKEALEVVSMLTRRLKLAGASR
jgi:hypothetical protein